MVWTQNGFCPSALCVKRMMFKQAQVNGGGKYGFRKAPNCCHLIGDVRECINETTTNGTDLE